MYDYSNKSNEKQVKETVSTWSQNWLFPATGAQEEAGGEASRMKRDARIRPESENPMGVTGEELTVGLATQWIRGMLNIRNHRRSCTMFCELKAQDGTWHTQSTNKYLLIDWFLIPAFQ